MIFVQCYLFKNDHFSYLVAEKILGIKKKKKWKEDGFWLQDASYKDSKKSVSIENLVEDWYLYVIPE